MNSVDATYLRCETVFRWLIGTERLCRHCQSRIGSERDAPDATSVEFMPVIVVGQDGGARHIDICNAAVLESVLISLSRALDERMQSD